MADSKREQAASEFQAAQVPGYVPTVRHAFFAGYDAAEQASRERIERLEQVLVTAAIPLEALHASVTWELADSVKAGVAEAVLAIRAALGEESTNA